jgi:tripartite-type tricarboxylate transporter receptor subunit TctC
VRFVVPFAAGGGVDISGRILAQRMSEQSGYNIIIDNRPGANGNLGAELVAKGGSDGYTLLMSAGDAAGHKQRAVRKASLRPRA